MDLRNLPEQLSSSQRINQRRTLIERETGIALDLLAPSEGVIGDSEKVNCEQMFGMIPLPVGYVGPVTVHFSNNTKSFLHVPVATTEGALVASMNRGAKATSASGIIIKQSIHRGITRSIAFKIGRAHV